MKKNYTDFICDRNGCTREIQCVSNKGFPYSKGWIYLYEFLGKTSNSVYMKNKDKHFCSALCMRTYIIKAIDSAVQTSKGFGGK